MSWLEPDDDGGWAEAAYDAGWISEDVVEEIRALLKEVVFEARPGNRSDAALILIDLAINPPDPKAPVDPTVLWAKTLLKDIL